MFLIPPPKKFNKGILWVQKCGQIGQLIKILSKQRNCTFCREASLICYSCPGIMMIQCSHITSHRREVLTAHQRLLCWRGSRRTDSSCRLLLLSFSGDAHRWVTPIQDLPSSHCQRYFQNRGMTIMQHLKLEGYGNSNFRIEIQIGFSFKVGFHIWDLREGLLVFNFPGLTCH